MRLGLWAQALMGPGSYGPGPLMWAQALKGPMGPSPYGPGLLWVQALMGPDLYMGSGPMGLGPHGALALPESISGEPLAL